MNWELVDYNKVMLNAIALKNNSKIIKKLQDDFFTPPFSFGRGQNCGF